MKAALPPVIAFALILSLAGNVYQFLERKDLRQQVAEVRADPSNSSVPGGVVTSNPVSESTSSQPVKEEVSAAASEEVASASSQPAPVEGSPFGSPSEMREVMKSPAMQQMIRGQHQSMVDMVYGEMFNYFDLNEDEQRALNKLLVDKQLAGLDLVMEFMDPNISAEERKALGDEIEAVYGEADQAVRDTFASEEDLAFYESYKESLPERWHLANLRSSLENTDIPLSGDQEQAMLDMMYAERASTDFEHDFSNQENLNLNELTPQAYEKFSAESQVLTSRIMDRANTILEPGQMDTFRSSHQQTQAMQQMGLRMMTQMMGASSGEQ